MKIKWKDISITKKIFFIILLSMTVILSLFLVIQGFLYGKIYDYTKKISLENSMIDFSEEYKELKDKNEINRKITEYSAKNNAYIMVVDSNGIKYAVSYEMEIQTSNGEKMSFSLDGALKSKDFSQMNIKQNDEVTVTFLRFNYGKSDLYIPESISNKNGEWKNPGDRGRFFFRPREGTGRRKEHTPDSVTGRVISIVTPVVEYNDTTQRFDALSALISWLENDNVYDKEGIAFNTYINPDTKEKYTTAFMPLGNEQFLFSVTSVRHIDEAVSIFKNMVVPWLIVACIMALVIGAGFAFVITKPIVTLTSITTKMKNLDFSEHCTVSGEDEIGLLSNNINEMSDKLDVTIKELLAANEKLTEDISRERIIEKQRREFVAAVSHELKTPLAIIRAYAEGLIDGVSEKKKDKYMNVIIEETKKMDTLVLDMLENSKLEAGAEKLNIKRYSVKKIAEKYIKLFDENFRQKDLNVILNCDGDGIADFDCDKIEQVISNFLSNAWKNSFEGGKVIVDITENEKNVRVSVENTGKQIPENELEKIWDKFYKCDKSRERKDNGTGLGLSIAKNILILHNAGYGVKNADNGVAFYFELQKNRGEAVANEHF